MLVTARFCAAALAAAALAAAVTVVVVVQGYSTVVVSAAMRCPLLLKAAPAGTGWPLCSRLPRGPRLKALAGRAWRPRMVVSLLSLLTSVLFGVCWSVSVCVGMWGGCEVGVQDRNE